MAVTIDIASADAISLDEYTDYVEHNVDLKDLDSICASAFMFKRLLNNKRLLTDVLNAELLNWRKFQKANAYSGQTFLLVNRSDFLVRANIWVPPSFPGASDDKDNIFSYRVPHDHNFTFMTGGYFGSGYETTIYEYDGAKVAGIPGEPVQMNFLEHTSLPQGKIMVYRASQDIHNQEHPAEFSVSLNLLVAPPNPPYQYLFDLESRKITNYIHYGAACREAFCDMACHFNDAETVSLLEEISSRHSDPHLRAASLVTLATLQPDSAVGMFRAALRDKDDTVRQTALRKLSTLERRTDVDVKV